MSKKRNQLLIVDDSTLDLAILNEIFKQEFEVTLTSNTQVALAFVSQHKAKLAAIIVDVRLSRYSNGMSLLQSMHGIKGAERIPIILITSDAHEEIVRSGMEAGAIDFFVKPVKPLQIQERIRTIVQHAWVDHPEDILVSEQESEGDGEISLREAEELSLCWQTKLVRALRYRPMDFLRRGNYIKKLTFMIADAYIRQHPETKMTSYHASLISFASLFSDLGQIALPDKILTAGPTQEDPGRSIFNQHPLMGHELFEGAPKHWEPFSTYCRDIVRFHHERYDGTGYPAHIARTEIPLCAQFVHAAWFLDELFLQFALNHDCLDLMKGKAAAASGQRVSPAIAKILISIIPQLEDLHQIYHGLIQEV